MKGVKYLMVILLVVLALACSDTRQGQPDKSLPDNPENRTAVAKRYMEIMPPKDMLHGLASRIVSSLPEKNRKAFMDIMQGQEMEKFVSRITLDGLVKHFTVGELNAMVTFYGSPEGQSALKKFGPLMAEVMPQIQQEVKKAMEALPKEPEAKEPQKPKAPPAPPGPKEQKAPPSKK